MRADGAHVAARHARLGEHGDGGVGEPAAEVHGEATVLARRSLAHGGEHALALQARVLVHVEAEELHVVPRAFAWREARHRGRDAVEGRAGHESAVHAAAARVGGHQATAGGGASITRRITPPPSASRFVASSALTPSACITMASLTLPLARPSRARDCSRVRPHTSATMRSLRSASLALVARRSTIRLPKVLPSRIIAPVVIMFRINFVAVPALRRVLPVTTSGPVMATMGMSTWAIVSGGGGEQATMAVRAPISFAYVRATRTYGVVPDAAMPTTKSPLRTPRAARSRRACSRSSSAPSCALVSAGVPPAMIPCTISGSVPKVGGHSEASSTPSRPDVPAPT